MSISRCIATGTALSVSSCIRCKLSLGNLYLVICIISHLKGLKVICQGCSQSISLSMSCCKLSWSVCLFIFR